MVIPKEQYDLVKSYNMQADHSLHIIHQQISFYDLILKWLNSTSSYETQRSYRTNLEDFFNLPLNQINFDIVTKVNILNVQTYIESLTEKGLKSSTIKCKLSACSSFYEYLLSFRSNEQQQFKLLSFNPFKNGIIKQMKSKKLVKGDAQITETLMDDELKRLYEVIDTSNTKGLRDFAIIKVLLNGALRRTELVNLKIKDIYEREFEYWLHIEQGKGNKNRDNYINPEVVQAIEIYLNQTGRSIKDRSEDFIFKGLSTNKLNGDRLSADAIKQLIQKYCRMAGIDKQISPHSMRHKTVTTLLENNVKPELVMEFCGHASINTTMRYWHNLNRVKNNAGRNISL